jgi:hypothetical protein
MHDPNDKAHWVSHPEDELEFVLRFGLQLRLIMNPAKEVDRYAPDLFSIKMGTVADLKVQKEPYRTSERYGVPTERCVTLNVYDLTRYSVYYGGEFPIYFWLDHPENANNGVYVATCREIMDSITFKRRKVHGYITRDGSDGNKTHSWVLDVSDFGRLI